jgi:hypothetical protein
MVPPSLDLYRLRVCIAAKICIAAEIDIARKIGIAARAVRRTPRSPHSAVAAR